MSEHYDYDVIIIGAGISGLVCGCYLAKAGLKTLIVEKNANVGGYCTSFKRNGYYFDACVHALSSLRKGGLLDALLQELGIINKLKFNRFSPSDAIITPEFRINIYSEVNRTVEEFKHTFPREKENLDKFFKYTVSSSFLEIRSKTFEELLNSYFHDKQLKSLFSIIMMQLLGVHSSKLSAMVACLLWREFMLDGGYYPIGGMQTFADAVLERFKEFKGKIFLNKTINKIILKNNKATGVTLGNNDTISCKFVVSACDAKQTFLEFLDTNKLDKLFVKKLNEMKISSSGFLLYLGLDKTTIPINELKKNFYIINDFDIVRVNSNYKANRIDHLVLTSSSVRNGNKEISLFLGTNARFNNANYWSNETNKEKWAGNLLNLAENLIPSLSKNISLQVIATPLTLYKRTGNYLGAGYGWSTTPDQFGNPDFSQKTLIENLYLSGHWSNQSSGVSFVANCARDTAELIIRKKC